MSISLLRRSVRKTKLPVYLHRLFRVVTTFALRKNLGRIDALKGNICRSVRAGDLEKTLSGLAQLEIFCKTGPRMAGQLLEEHLADAEKLQQLGQAATNVAEKYPNSVLLTYFSAVALAESGEYEQANTLVNQAVINSHKPSMQSKYLPSYARHRTSSFIKIWRTLDFIARQNMQWMPGGQAALPSYESLDFMADWQREESEDFDPQLALFYAEPLLQGKHEEKYLRLCRQIFEQSHGFNQKLKAISAMTRQGIRRLANYHASYRLAEEAFLTLKEEWEEMIRPLECLIPVEPKKPLQMAGTLRSLMNKASELGYADDVARLQKALMRMASAPWGQETIWTVAAALIEQDPIANREISTQLIESSNQMPKTTADIKAYMEWSIAVQEYERAYAFFSTQPTKVKRHRVGLVYVKLLQRMGKFAEAAIAAQEVHIAMLSCPFKLCPYTSWDLIKRVGELRFAAETAEIYSMVPQPTKPEGVIFITPRSIEQMRKTPLVVLMELKRMGWAIVPLMEGVLPLEKTGIDEIDRYAGCMTFNRQLMFDATNAFDEIEDFNIDLEHGKLSWGDIDLSTALWEESSINRRLYHVDFTCPALQKYLGNVTQVTYLAATILHNLRQSMAKLNIRTGVLIQFTSRLPDAIYRFYCEKHGDADNFFCLHAANGYQNYFANFSTEVSTKAVVRNMTRHAETRSAGFPIPAEFEKFYEENRHQAPNILEMTQGITKMKRSTAGQKEMPMEGKLALKRIQDWKEKGGKVACAFGKVVCDPGMPIDGGPAHTSMKDWLNHTIQSAKDSDMLLLIKPHPHEVKESVACFINEYFSDLIEGELPDNVIMIGHTWFDIHMLNDIVDLGLIYNGTTAVELGVMGMPAVLCAHYAPIDYPVGHAVPRDREHYRKLVRFEDAATVKEDLMMRSACWLYYMGSDYITLDYRYHARPITNKVVYPSWWFEEDIMGYLSAGDANVTELAQRAVA